MDAKEIAKKIVSCGPEDLTPGYFNKCDEDRERGHRYRSDCCDCGGPMYQFFNRATWSWSERPSHMGDNCVQTLRKRIEALEMAAKETKWPPISPANSPAARRRFSTARRIADRQPGYRGRGIGAAGLGAGADDYFEDGDVTAVANDYLRLRAENEALKSDAVNWGAWRERVAAEFFQSDRFGMNDIWIAITALIRQRDEAQARCASVDQSLVDGVIEGMKIDMREARASAEVIENGLAALIARAETAERERDEAMQSFRTAIELEGPQKYATLLDERDALAGRLEAAETALGNLRGHSECLCNEAVDILAAINPAPEPIIPPSC